jgi:molybdate transport system substrate-binding protein
VIFIRQMYGSALQPQQMKTPDPLRRKCAGAVRGTGLREFGASKRPNTLWRLTMIRSIFLRLCIASAGLFATSAAHAADIKVLTAGAMKSVVLALQPGFEAQSGHKLVVDNGTAGDLARRIGGGEAFDVAIITPPIVAELIKQGKLAAGTDANIAAVGIGVAVKEGAAKPAIATVEEFKQALLAAGTVAYIDPRAGGSSGIYFDKLLEKLGIADAVRAKAKLKASGYVAELIVSGEADLAIHQISEILPVKGVTLVGPLPAEIQNFTIYTVGLSPSANNADAAKAFAGYLASPAVDAILTPRGLTRAPASK